jgi:hypothetical protein
MWFGWNNKLYISWQLSKFVLFESQKPMQNCSNIYWAIGLKTKFDMNCIKAETHIFNDVKWIKCRLLKCDLLQLHFCSTCTWLNNLHFIHLTSLNICVSAFMQFISNFVFNPIAQYILSQKMNYYLAKPKVGRKNSTDIQSISLSSWK